jgi:hypothetical protein
LPFHDRTQAASMPERRMRAQRKILEADHRSGPTFDGTVVLLDNIVQVLDLACGVAALQSCSRSLPP